MSMPVPITLEDLITSMNSQLLSVLTSWQEGSVESIHAWIKAVAPMMPDLNLYHELPTAMQDLLGNPEGIIESYYQLAIAVLNLQRDFIHEVFTSSMVAPRTPYLPPASRVN